MQKRDAHRQIMPWVVVVSFLISQGCSSIPDSPQGRRGLFQRGLDHPASASGNLAKSARDKPVSKYRISWSQYLKIKQKIRDWDWPLKKVRFSSHFGKRKRRFHEGVDLKARVGTPIFAVSEGKVYYSGSGISGYGRMTILKHPGNLYTIYAHNKTNLLKKGDSVKKGQLIAYSGRSGRVTGPHLHFEIRHGTEPLNPVRLLPRRI